MKTSVFEMCRRILAKLAREPEMPLSLNEAYAIVDSLLKYIEGKKQMTPEALQRAYREAEIKLKTHFEANWDKIFMTLLLNGRTTKVRDAWDKAWLAYSGRRVSKETPEKFLRTLTELKTDIIEKLEPKEEPVSDPFLRNAQILDEVANELQAQSPVLAFALDKISDQLDKMAVTLAPREVQRRMPGLVRPYVVEHGKPSPERTETWTGLGNLMKVIDSIDDIKKRLEKLNPAQATELGTKIEKAKTLLDDVRENLNPSS